jgi:hypothetical protein
MITLAPDDNNASQMITFLPKNDNISPQTVTLAPDDNIASQMITFHPR